MTERLCSACRYADVDEERPPCNTCHLKNKWVSKADTEREAKIQRMAEMIYAAELIDQGHLSLRSAACGANNLATDWARMVREGEIALPDFK